MMIIIIVNKANIVIIKTMRQKVMLIIKTKIKIKMKKKKRKIKKNLK